MAPAGIEDEAIEQQAQNGGSLELPMRGRFTQYVSPFLQFFGPLISMRYLGIAFEKINPLNILDKKYKKGAPWNPSLKEGLSRNTVALGMGSFLLTGLSIYSKRTYDDMRTLYAEAVGYELGKKPEEVTARDIFFRSRNKVVRITAEAYLKRTALRATAAASFLVPWHRITPKENTRPDYSANIDAGVGTAALYISSEGWIRSQSYFDLQQYMADTAINHHDVHIHDVVQSKNIQSLLFLQRKHLDKRYQRPKLNSAEIQNEMPLADRIADLMNQTYHNRPNTEHANFTLGKFNYLEGFGLLDQYPANLAFVELANRSSDMKDVNAAAAAIKSGQSPQEVFKSFGIDMNLLAAQNTAPVSGPQTAKFVDRMPRVRDKSLVEPRAHQEFAASADNHQQNTRT